MDYGRSIHETKCLENYGSKRLETIPFLGVENKILVFLKARIFYC